MNDPESQLSLLDGVVQQLVLALEQGKDRVFQVAESAKVRQGSMSSEIGSLRGAAQAQSAEFERLQQGVEAARERLDQVIRSGAPDPAVLSAALEAWADERAELRVARERAGGLLRQADALETERQGLAAIGALGDEALAQFSDSIELLAENFRELGSKLESAQQSKALGLHVIRAQEEERRRLAREIHDGPAQLLNSVVLRINVCLKLFDTDLQRLGEELNQLKELVRLSLQDVRKIIFDLRPMALDDLGLIPALRAFLKDYQARFGIETDFVAFGNERRFDSAFEIAIFRLVQEALNNVYKHAGAARVWVKVDTAGGQEVRLTVRDDGVGFDPEKLRQTQAGTKFGLVGMRERTELLGGSMEIISAPGQSARLNFTFPVGE